MFVYILGCNRSGTTLLQNLFRCANGTKIINGEVAPCVLFYIKEKLATDGVCLIGKRCGQMNQFGMSFGGFTLPNVYGEVAYSYNVSGEVIVSTREEMIFWTQWLNQWKDIWHIHMRRDPRDVLVSVMGKGKIKSYPADFDMWKNTERIYSELKKANDEKTLLVRYEDLIKEPDVELEKIFNTIGRKKDFVADKWIDLLDPTEQKHQSMEWLNGARKIDNCSIGNWKRNPDRIKKLLEKHPDLPQTVVDFGYDKKGWEENL